MRSDSVARTLRDIPYHVDLAEAFVAGLDSAAFQSDLRTLFAVTRCLEIISEASRRLPSSLKDRHSAIPWKRMAGAGNVYRHDYEDVAANYIWDTLQKELPSLRAVIEHELSRGEPT
jgi:uncharacterized protein with HEPN domain